MSSPFETAAPAGYIALDKAIALVAGRAEQQATVERGERSYGVLDFTTAF